MNKSSLPFVIIGGVLLIAIGVSVWLFNQKPPASPTNNLSTNTNNPRAIPPGAEPARTHGNPNAKVYIEEFGDFQCPPCGALHPDMKKIEAEFGDSIAFTFRNFPLTKLHPYAYDAARAAEAAGMQNKYWEMHDKIYDNQSTWTAAPDPRAEFENYARLLGLNVEQFRNDSISPMVSGRVRSDVQRGDAIGVTGTPTVFINGHQVSSENTTLEGIRKIIQAELKK